MLETLTIADGIAYQIDRSQSVTYGQAYFDKLKSYEGSEISNLINKGRVSLVSTHYQGKILDVGIGAGEFIRTHGNACGYDINPVAVDYLKEAGLYSDDFFIFSGFTFWDVIEHLKEPYEYFDLIESGSYLFTSIPIYENFDNLFESKHYRPNEHYWYFTHHGFKAWMKGFGFSHRETSFFETEAGRESIWSYVFRKL